MRKIIFAVCLLMGLKSFGQYDSQITQYMFNGIYLNPAYTGYKEDQYVQSFYRMQWAGFPGAPTTFSISGDWAFEDKPYALGVLFSKDNIAANSIVKGYIQYAYRIQLGSEEDSKLAFGMAAGGMQLGLDGTKLHTINPDNEVPTTKRNDFIPDANFGVFYSNSKYFGGVSVTNTFAKLFRNKTSNQLIPVPKPHVYVTGGAIFPLDSYEESKLKTVFLWKNDFHSPPVLDVNAMFILNQRFLIGGFYRTSLPSKHSKLAGDKFTMQNAVGFLGEVFATSNLRIGYSYDHSLNELQNNSYGSHELSIGIYLKALQPSKILRCYKF